MKSGRPDNALYFNEIAAIEPDFVYLTGHLYLFDETDEEFTRLMRVQGEDWIHVFDMDEIAWSVCAFVDELGQRNCAMLGRNGGVAAYWGTANLDEDEIDMEPGKLFQMQKIGKALFACGSLNQVFQLKNSVWELHSKSIVADRDDGGNEAFFAIDGTSEKDFYCVGRFGTVVHFDGNSYKFQEVPTNVHLERVYCKSKNEIYVCGRDGVLFKGDGNGAWNDINDAGCEAHFWGLTEFDGQIYVCTDSELYAYDGKSLVAVDTELDEANSFYRLAATSEYLWATTGKDYVLRFDGSDWDCLVSSQS